MEPKYLPKRFGGDLDDGDIIDMKLIGSLLEKDEYFEGNNLNKYCARKIYIV